VSPVFFLFLWPFNSLFSRLVAALPAVVGMPATRTAERLSELISQSLFMSVHLYMTVTLTSQQREQSGEDAMRKNISVWRNAFLCGNVAREAVSGTAAPLLPHNISLSASTVCLPLYLS
jgi:hypothetical protein